MYLCSRNQKDYPMDKILIIGLLLPLAGTMLGSAFVFFMRKEIPDRLQKTLLAFAASAMMYVVVVSPSASC